jgi:hypothetical protein
MTAALQLKLMRLVVDLANTFGNMWQDVDEPSRGYEARRAVVATAMLAVFDVVVRAHATDEPLELSAMLAGENGGYSLSLEMGRKRDGKPLEKVTEALELLEPAHTRARDDALAYLGARRAKAAHVLFTMPLMNHGADGGGFTIELLKWSAETQFLRTFVDRCGYEVMPRGQARPPTEMDALVNWFCAGEAPPYKVLAEEHPEWTLLRDMVSLFKFMSSMLPLQRERMQLRAEVSEQRHYLTVDAGSSRVHRSRMMRSLAWTNVRVWGADNDKADVIAHGFGFRKLTWGDDNALLPLTDVASLLGDSSAPAAGQGDGPVTEDDVLHTESEQLPRYRGTLSAEESELLLSYLTVPYTRVPLVVGFFADIHVTAEGVARVGERVTYLFNEELQKLFRAALFEQGPWVDAQAAANAGAAAAAAVTRDFPAADATVTAAAAVAATASAGMAQCANGIERVPARRTARQEREFTDLQRTDARFGLAPAAAALGTPTGLLLNELRCSPEAALSPLMHMFRYVLEICKTTVHSDDANFILFLVSVAVGVEGYMVYALRYAPPGNNDDQDKHEGEGGTDPFFVSPGARETVAAYRAQLGSFLRVDVLRILDRWSDEARAEQSSDGLRNNNIPTGCVIHAYKALLFSHVEPEELTPAAAAQFLGSLAHVRAHHSFGQVLRNIELDVEDAADTKKVQKVVQEKMRIFLQAYGVNTEHMDLRPYLTGEPVWFVRGSLCLRIPLPGFTKKGQGFKPPPVELPEAEVFAVLARRRRGLVTWLAAAAPADVAAVMNGAVAIAMNSPDFACADWAPSPNRPRGVYGAESEGITLDCQSAEVLYRKSAIKPVPDSMTAFEDFELVFGREALQCAWKFCHAHRNWVEVIGEAHELMEWDAPDPLDQGVGVPRPYPAQVRTRAFSFFSFAHDSLVSSPTSLSCCRRLVAGVPRPCPAQAGSERVPITYDGVEFGRPYPYYFVEDEKEPPPPPHEHERWVVEALTPVLEAVYPKDPPDGKLDYALFLPAAPLPADATVCRLVGMSKEDKPHATWKEVVVYRDRGMVRPRARDA